MILDIFSELQRPGQRTPGCERRLIADAVAQAVLADEVGFGCWWAVEHHGMPDFSYSSAPDLMLAVIAQHTRRLRLGHSGVLAPHAINHPMRIAERAAFLDNVSDGRLELGLARSVPNEWEAFGSDPDQTRDEVGEVLRMLPQMWKEGPFSWSAPPGYAPLPPREVVPKPIQSPHPPLWVTAATPDGFEGAGRNGVGVLATVMLQPVEQLQILFDAYASGLQGARPVGAFTNAQRAVFAFFHCAETREEAIQSRAGEAALWFMNAQPQVFGVPRDMWIETIRTQNPLWEHSEDRIEPGTTQVAGDLEDPHPVVRLMNRLWVGQELDPLEVYEALEPLDSVIIGDAETCHKKLSAYADIGTDRVMCLMQMGHMSHEAVMASIRSTGKHLIPALAGRQTTQ
jgi:alkanesulfonate monooxygenase SsuD/methylene tetrahydromethanopterin reductase-like flavin-dependent oxidoreductase (luciferase family)